MRTIYPIWTAISILTSAAGCGEPAPSPVLKITAPTRSLSQRDAGPLMVTGIVTPGTPGDRVVNVTVNRAAATLQPDGSFMAMLDAPTGAMLIETVATSDSGASATDVRAVQSGQLRAVGTDIDRAITAAVSAEAFARLSAAAGQLLKTTDIVAALAPFEPLVNAGDELVNLQLSVTGFKVLDSKISLTPVAGGLAFSTELLGLDIAANVAYGGVLVVDGATPVTVHADQIAIAGTLAVTPVGTSGFTTQLVDPQVSTVGLRLSTSGLVGQALDLLNSVLGSATQTVVSSALEAAMEPLLNQALGAAAGPQQVDVMGKKLTLQVAPNAITLTPAGAQVAMNLAVKFDGSEVSPGYIFTDNGVPTLDVNRGLQLGIADDLVNELLAELHAIGALDLTVKQDFGAFDAAQLHFTMPPMISANTRDGAMRLVIGDLVASFTLHGKPVLNAAVNAQVDLAVAPAADARAVALQFGALDVRVNALDDTSNPAGIGMSDLSGASSAAITVHLESLSQLMINVPVPAVAGVQLEQLSIGSDSGYVMLSGQVR